LPNAKVSRPGRDEIKHVLKWKERNDVSLLGGKDVQLRFELENADFFSLKFKE
jgi:hypothetical protein